MPLADQIGLAMYTVRESARADLSGAFARLAELGYRAIEFYGEPAHSPAHICAALDASGLRFSGWHVEWRDLQEDRLDATVEYLLRAGCPLAVVPCLGGKWNIAHTREEECADVWPRYIDWMNRLETRLSRQTLRLGYHNHDHEFALSYGGKTVFDILFSGFSESIVMEFDSGNCIEAGVDPVSVLRRYAGREKILHLKPYSRSRGFQVPLGAPDDENDWRALTDPALGGYRWLLVESERDGLPEMENAAQCMEGVKPFLRETDLRTRKGSDAKSPYHCL